MEVEGEVEEGEEEEEEEEEEEGGGVKVMKLVSGAST